VPVRAFGQYGFRITDPRRFLEGIAGTAKAFTAPQVTDFFSGVLLQAVTVSISKAMTQQNISVLQLAAFLEELSEKCKEKVAESFSQYGVTVLSFQFQSINIPDNDPSLRKLKEIKEKSAELGVVGREVYQFDKSMDVLKTAAANQGTSGSVMQSAMGAGMGVLMGAQLGQQAGQMVQHLPPPPPVGISFFIAVNGQQSGPFQQAALQQLVATGRLSSTTLVWRQGMPGWQLAGSVPELASVMSPAAPPPLPPSGPTV
jgi:membrane protease subunit (stomatin/prohibitin family)